MGLHSPNILLTLIAALLATSLVASRAGDSHRSITYDNKSMIINGKRELIFSGSIHYPRTQPAVCSWITMCMHFCDILIKYA